VITRLCDRLLGAYRDIKIIQTSIYEHFTKQDTIKHIYLDLGQNLPKLSYLFSKGEQIG
jgi:hypothetical protein